MKKDRGRSVESAPVKNRPSSAYIYMVKNTSSNETSIWLGYGLYPGTLSLPYPIWLDYGVVASAHNLGRGYQRGNDQCCGSCLHSEAIGEEQVLEATQEQTFKRGEEEASGEEILYDTEPDEIITGPSSEGKPIEMVQLTGDTQWIDRLATPSDMSRYQELSAKEDEAMRSAARRSPSTSWNMKW